MNDYDSYRKLIIVAVLCLCPALVLAGGDAPAAGWSTFGGSFAEGSSFTCIFSGLGLEDAQVAEVHFVVQRHGVVRRWDREVLVDQVTEFMGGCPRNGCLDVHFAIHVATGDFETISNPYRFRNGAQINGATSTFRRMMGGIKMAINGRFDEGKDWYGMAGAD